MKLSTLIAALCTVLLVTSAAFAAPWDKSTRIERAVKKYKQDQVEVITGKVIKVYEKVPSFGKEKKDALGYHVVIHDGTEKIDIHLGPTWYLKSLDNRIVVGDVIEATGSTKEAGEKDGKWKPKQMRCNEIRRDGQLVMKLRDDNGRPVWSGTAFIQPEDNAMGTTTATEQQVQGQPKAN